MKNIFTLALLFVCINASAQKLSIGIKGGSTHTNITHRNQFNGNIEMLNAFNAALTVEYNFCPGFYLGSGAVYNQRGYKNIGYAFIGDVPDSQHYTYSGDYMLEYLSVPVYAGVKTNKRLYGYFNGGLLASRLMFMRLENISTNDNIVTLLKSGNYKITSNKIDIGLMAEAGMGYQFSDKIAATLSTSYIRDITNHRTSNMHSLFTQLGARYTF